MSAHKITYHDPTHYLATKRDLPMARIYIFKQRNALKRCVNNSHTCTLLVLALYIMSTYIHHLVSVHDPESHMGQCFGCCVSCWSQIHGDNIEV